MINYIEAFIEKANNKFGNKFTFPNIQDEYVKSKQLTIVCDVHGEFIVNSRDTFLHSGYGCAKCADVEKHKKKHSKNINDFLDKIKNDEFKKLLEFPNIFDEYKTLDSTVTVKCPKHDVFETTAHLISHTKFGCNLCANENLSNISFKNIDEFKHIENHFKCYTFDWSEFNGSDSPINVKCNTHNVEFKVEPWRFWTKKKGYSNAKFCSECLSEHKIAQAIERNKPIMLELLKDFDNINHDNRFKILTPIDDILNFSSKHNDIQVVCNNCNTIINKSLYKLVIQTQKCNTCKQ